MAKQAKKKHGKKAAKKAAARAPRKAVKKAARKHTSKPKAKHAKKAARKAAKKRSRKVKAAPKPPKAKPVAKVKLAATGRYGGVLTTVGVADSSGVRGEVWFDGHRICAQRDAVLILPGEGRATADLPFDPGSVKGEELGTLVDIGHRTGGKSRSVGFSFAEAAKAKARLIKLPGGAFALTGVKFSKASGFKLAT